MKKISVITINFNNCYGLEKTIKSVIEQTSNNFEYIIIDGGSTDGSAEIIKKYSDKIDYWISEPDNGIFNAMNKGILKATGEYYNFMNSGDYFHANDVIEKVISELDKDIVVGKYIYGNLSYPWGRTSDSISMLDFVKGGISHQASFINKKLFENNFYDENYKIASDWKFFIDVLIFKNCSYKNIDLIIANFDATGISISSTFSELNKSERSRILKEFLPERIYYDYLRLAKSDSKLLELTPFFNKTNGFQNLIFNIVYILIKIRKIFLNIKNTFYIFDKR